MIRRTPKVSIILPTHNRAHTLKRAVDSVLRQTYSDHELIVVDDGSTDGTHKLMAGFRDPRIRFLHLEETMGAANARNEGLSRAEAEWIAFQDSDDEWETEKLRKQTSVLSQSPPEVGVVYSDMTRIYADGNREYFAAPDINSQGIVNLETKDYGVARIGIQSTLIRKTCFETAGGFDPALPAYEDLECLMRIGFYFRFHHLRESLVNYHETEGISSDPEKMKLARKIILRKHAGKLKDYPWFIAKEIACTHD